MIEQRFQLTVNDGVQIPEIVGLHQIAVITRDHEIRIIFKKQVANVR